MPQFVHMDISADDPERAATFYSRVFGWTVTRLAGPVPYWLVTPPTGGTAPGAGVARREAAWQGITPMIEVDSADDYARAVVAAGGSIVTPKAEIAGVGQLVTCRDTEGNVIGLLQPLSDNAFAPPSAG